MSEELPDYYADSSATNDAAYWRARAERAEAALAADMPTIQEITQLYERILELEKRNAELELRLDIDYPPCTVDPRVSELQARVDQLEAGWIPCDERTPDVAGNYMFAMIPNLNGDIHLRVEFYDPEWGRPFALFTHWRPLPAPPKESLR